MDDLELKLKLLGYRLLTNPKEDDKNIKKTVLLAEKNKKFFVLKKIAKEIIPIYNMLKNVRHKHIAYVEEVFEDGEDGIVVEEYISGKTIRSNLEKYGLFEEEEVVTYALQLCDALEFLHKNNIVHRDITAVNVIISCEGEVKLIDFGISRIEKKISNYDTTLLGTEGYAAPEQYGFMQSDKRTDIFSLGVLINIMLTDKFPKDELCKGYFRSIVLKCTNFLPERRYENISRLKSDIIIKGKRKKFIALIPGFRTGRIINKIIAIYIYSSVLLLVLMTPFIIQNKNGILFEVIFAVFGYIIPFWGISDFLYYTDKIYFIRDHKVLKIILRILVSVFSFILGTYLIIFLN